MNENFIREISIDWNYVEKDSYLRNIKALTNLTKMEFDSPITYFVGENGTGKSTLLEAIAVAYGFNAEGGTLNYRFSTFDDVSNLSNAIKLSKSFVRPKGNYFFRAESFFNVASKMEDYRDNFSKTDFYRNFGGKSLHEQSHGESFLSLFQSNQNAGIYIMDEPEAALSPQRQLTLLIHISKMVENGAQFIIATHSPILLGIPNSTIYSFDNGNVATCEYEDTDCYNIMKMFLNDRELFIKRLLEDI